MPLPGRGRPWRRCCGRSGPAGHKGSRGHLLLVAGSPGKTGAAVLCAPGAVCGRAPGWCTIASTAAGQVALDAKVLEPMTACYAGGDDADGQSFDQLSTLAGRMKAAALGPGIPTGPGMAALVARLARELPLPLVIDADGLNLLGPDRRGRPGAGAGAAGADAAPGGDGAAGAAVDRGGAGAIAWGWPGGWPRPPGRWWC